MGRRAQLLLHPVGQHGRLQGVAAELEEVVEYADALDAEHFLPLLDKEPLHRRARGHVVALQIRPGLFRRGQGAAIHLAVRVQRQRIHENELRRDHVVGQACLQVGPQVADRDGRARLCDDVCHDAALAILAHHDEHLAQVGMLRQHRLDFARLDAEPANLHLLVDAAQEFDRPVRQPAHEVAGAVDTICRLQVRKLQAGRLQLVTCNL